jgi:thioredoxin reductase (NADPH)
VGILRTGSRDLVIVGAGPSGLGAAIEGGENGLDTLLIEANTNVGGQAKSAQRILNYPGYSTGISGRRLFERMYEQVQSVGAETKLGVRVTRLSYERDTGLKTLTLSDGEKVEARAVVIAVGTEFRRLDFPGSDLAQVIYGDVERLIDEGSGKTVVILGAEWAGQAALDVARTALDVYLVWPSSFISRMSALKRGLPIEGSMSALNVDMVTRQPNIRVIENDEATEFWVDQAGNRQSLKLKSGMRLNANVVGVFVGGAPDLSWLPPEIGRRRGKVATHDQETAIPMVFAVGDACRDTGTIVSAVGDGISAALKCASVIRPEGIRRPWSE